jgi:hypothetical protein
MGKLIDVSLGSQRAKPLHLDQKAAKLIPQLTAKPLKTSDRVAHSCEIMNTVNGDS